MITLSTGKYQTRDGHECYIWEWGKNALEEECWIGTTKGVGLSSWDENGKSLDGDKRFDIVSQ